MIGLGLMGTALTERLLDHNHRVAVWNRTRAKAAPLLARGAVWSDNPVACCQRVIISLYTSDVVAEVLQQMETGFQPGQIIVDTTAGEPEQTHVRATGSGIAYNVGRFATAIGVFFAGVLFAAVGGSYSRVGSLCGLVYALGLVVIWWAPDTSKKNLQE